MSLSGPHLGALYLGSLVSAGQHPRSLTWLTRLGMWFLSKWKSSGSLEQLALTDSSDLYSTFMYKLSKAKGKGLRHSPAAHTHSGIESFKHVIFVSSPQDKYDQVQVLSLTCFRYVTTSSALVIQDEQAMRDTKCGTLLQQSGLCSLCQDRFMRK